MNNLYEILNLDLTATPDDIVRAYRRRAKATHPNHNGTGKTAEFQAVQHAYDVLSDKERRARYDADGFTGEQSAMEAKAMLELSQLIMLLIDQTEDNDFDVVARAKQEICRQQVDLSAQAMAATKQADKYRAKSVKFKSKKAGENVFMVILENRVRDCERQARQFKDGMERCDIMLALLEGYSYEADKPKDGGTTVLFGGPMFSDYFSSGNVP